MDKTQAEFRDYIESGFNLVKTADGSLSLMQEGLNEEMHSRSGAFSESLYVYHDPLKAFLKENNLGEIEVISVGLGFGYNEILVSLIAKDLNVKVSLISYEKEKVLTDLFKKRISNINDYPEFFKPYLKNFSKDQLEKAALHLLDEAEVTFKEELNLETVKDLSSSSKGILFDAYCNKTSASLWTESFLKELLNKSNNPSFFSTYASTGTLNRALKEAGFIKSKKREGFAGKRESTLAFKI